MPSVEDIAAIKVSVYQSTSRRKDIEPFELPKSYYGKVLDYFGGFVIDHSPNLSLPEVGSILIRTKDGRIRRISWYGGAQAPIMFSLQGIRCIAHGGRIRRPSAEEAIDLDSLIREAAGAR